MARYGSQRSLIILRSVLLSLAVFVVAPLLIEEAKEAGRLEVASGKYQCALVTQPDKTSKWVCEKRKDYEKAIQPEACTFDWDRHR